MTMGSRREWGSRQSDKMIRNYKYLKLNSKWNAKIHIPLGGNSSSWKAEGKRQKMWNSSHHKMIDSSISSSLSLQSSGALSLSESYFHQIEQILYPSCLTARTWYKLYTSQSIELRRTCRKYIFPLFSANQNRTNRQYLLALTPSPMCWNYGFCLWKIHFHFTWLGFHQFNKWSWRYGQVSRFLSILSPRKSSMDDVDVTRPKIKFGWENMMKSVWLEFNEIDFTSS